MNYRGVMFSLICSMFAAIPVSAETKTAVFAGGCFWCMEPPFDKKEGVISTTSGYSGGTADTANYETVSSGKTEHLEVIQVEYNPEVVTYRELLEIFWRNIDPLDASGQFCDKGAQYRSALFYEGEEEKKIALESKDAIEKKLGRPVVTEILPRQPFFPAESYHQDYYKNNPLRYKYYRFSCGRDGRLEKLWGDEKN